MAERCYYFNAHDIEVMFNDECAYPGLDEGGITLIAGDDPIIFLEATPDDLRSLVQKIETFLKENDL